MWNTLLEYHPREIFYYLTAERPKMKKLKIKPYPSGLSVGKSHKSVVFKSLAALRAGSPWGKVCLYLSAKTMYLARCIKSSRPVGSLPCMLPTNLTNGLRSSFSSFLEGKAQLIGHFLAYPKKSILEKQSDIFTGKRKLLKNCTLNYASPCLFEPDASQITALNRAPNGKDLSRAPSLQGYQAQVGL